MKWSDPVLVSLSQRGKRESHSPSKLGIVNFRDVRQYRLLDPKMVHVSVVLSLSRPVLVPSVWSRPERQQSISTQSVWRSAVCRAQAGKVRSVVRRSLFLLTSFSFSNSCHAAIGTTHVEEPRSKTWITHSISL